jgi:hypothetical protein
VRASQIAFNIVALLIAGMCVVTLLSALFMMIPDAPPEKRGFWYFAKGRLAPWPTGTMIAGYCITIWLLPLAIWGVLALLAEMQRQRSEPENA